MFGYQQAYAPVYSAPMYSRRLSPIRLSQATPAPTPAPSKLNPGVIRTAIAGGLVVETTLGAAGAWVGLFTGQHAKGLLSILGYGIGAISAISGVVSLAELVIFLAKGMPIPQIPAGPAVQQPAVPITG